jgi:hypothetical protein
MKRPFKLIRLNEDDEEWDDEDEWDESGPEALEVDGPSFAPTWSGLLDADGEPILRHPVVIRMGFHPADNKYHTPTLDDSDTPGAGSVVGFVYGPPRK